MTTAPDLRKEENPFSGMPDLAENALACMQVSPTSRWDSEVWQLSNTSVGQPPHNSRLSWVIPLNDGSLLTDAQYAPLLAWLRMLTWSLLSAPGDGASPIHVGSLSTLANGYRRVVPWLVNHGITQPSAFSTALLDDFLSDLPAMISTAEDDVDGVEGETDETIGFAAAFNAVRFFYHVWRQRQALIDAGFSPMPGPPWPEARGANEIARLASGKAAQLTPPLPDPVATRLLNRIEWILGAPADELIQAHNRRQVSDPVAWQQNLNSTWQANLSTTELPAWGPLPRKATLAKLTHDMIGACCVALEGFTGMRPSELLSFTVSEVGADNIPSAITVRETHSGWYEEFIITATLSKGSSDPRDLPWLLGSRRKGETCLPLAVRAFQVLNRIMPYRIFAETSSLIAVPVKGRSIASRKPESTDIVSAMRQFAERHVDFSPTAVDSPENRKLLDEWRHGDGTKLTNRHLRKTFAHYVLSIHADLLPAVKWQFKHVNMAITESSYWGRSTVQIEPIHSVSRQLTARMIYQAMHDAPLAGKMGGNITGAYEDLRRQLADESGIVAWQSVYTWVEKNDIEATHSVHGSCLPITASRMACWSLVNARPTGPLRPNFATRSASLCAGCKSFVLDGRHLPFWCERLRACEIACEVAGPDDPTYRIIRARLEQAQRIVASLQRARAGEELT